MFIAHSEIFFLSVRELNEPIKRLTILKSTDIPKKSSDNVKYLVEAQIGNWRKKDLTF